MLMNPAIFREYDVRGVVGKDFDEEFAHVLARAVARVITRSRGKRVILGRDCRLSSPSLSRALCQGMMQSGLEITDIGVVTTPIHYFSLFQLKADGGVQVSGSHNPPDQNGFKISLGHDQLYGAGIKELKTIIEAKDFPEGPGSSHEQDMADEYIRYITENIQLARPMRVVVDAGNGTAGPFATAILKKLGCEVIELNTEMDGRFPNHHPDPTVPENLVDLQKKVLEAGADVGIGYDGDADRIGVIDDRGQIVWGDILMIVLSRAVLEEVPGATIVGEVKCSHRLFNDIEKRGGKSVMWKAGHSLIKARMRELSAELGGEMSGHIFYQHRYFGFDDAIYTGCRLLELLSRSDRRLSEILSDVPPAFSTPEIRIPSSDERKFEIVEQARKYFREKYKTVEVDGVRVEFPDGWGLVRASNTQPMLVMRFEAETEDRLAEIRRLVESKVNELNQGAS
jgi:phosphomannomutase/phosphoglucomutase